MDNLSLIELKKIAKTRRIKQYYIMKKDDLLALLHMQDLPMKFKLEKMTITELRGLAKERGMRGFWGLPKEKLMNLLFPSVENEKQNNSQTSEHEDPQSQNSDEVGVKVLKNSFEDRTNNVDL
jgi:hypothetical protein